MSLGLGELAAEVAACMGDGWTTRGPAAEGAGVTIGHPRRGRISMVRQRGDESRLDVFGRPDPEHPLGVGLLRGTDLGHITVGTGRGPTAIAGHIARRLLPVYERGLSEYRRSLEVLTAAESRRADALTALADAIGAEPSEKSVSWEPGPAAAARGCRGWASFTPMPGGGGVRVGVDLTVPPAEAVRIARLLARTGADPEP